MTTRFLLLLLAISSCAAGPGDAAAFGPVGAGRWYPADAGELSSMLDGFLDCEPVRPGGRIMAIISPHAGYIYSGSIAGAAFSSVRDRDYEAVVILGFSHRGGFSGISVFDSPAYMTPLGAVEVDREVATRIIEGVRGASFNLSAYSSEHSVENLIPFVQAALPGTRIVPVMIGRPDSEGLRELASLLARLTGEGVLVAASTDFSHYHGLDRAEAMDNAMIEAIIGEDIDEIERCLETGEGEVCGVYPVLVTAAAMREAGARGTLLAYGTSADATGSTESVVGYAAIAFSGEVEEMESGTELSEREKAILLETARTTIEAVLEGREPPPLSEAEGHLAERRGAFVTLRKNGRLRGCIGVFTPNSPLIETVREYALHSALHDSRFRPVTRDEMDSIEIEISVLTPPETVSGPDEIVLGRDGIIVREGGRSGTYLPQVATETGWTVEEFLSSCARDKAGLSPDAWRNGAEILTYRAEVFSEGEVSLRGD